MKTFLLLFTSLSIVLFSCKKDDTASDYRDQFTGSYLCNDSSVTYHLTWTGDSITGSIIDTIFVQMTAVVIEKMTTTDSSVSLLGKEFWVSRSGKFTKAWQHGPLGMSYSHDLSVTNGRLNYEYREHPLSLSYFNYRKVTGNRSQ